MDQANFWNSKHLDYAKSDWINKPTIFADWALSFFPKSGSILELGAGQGQDSRYFAQKGYSVTSTDFSDQALATNQEKADAEHLPIKTMSVDLNEKLPFPDNCFDIVYAHLSIHHFSDVVTKQIFSDINRILLPGGVVALLANSTKDPELTEGAPIEPNFIELDGVQKRFFTPQTIENYAQAFETIACDREGTTHKDPIKLVRYIGRKKY